MSALHYSQYKPTTDQWFATGTKLKTTVTRTNTCKCGGVWLTKQWLPSTIMLTMLFSSGPKCHPRADL